MHGPCMGVRKNFNMGQRFPVGTKFYSLGTDEDAENKNKTAKSFKI